MYTCINLRWGGDNIILIILIRGREEREEERDQERGGRKGGREKKRREPQRDRERVEKED